MADIMSRAYEAMGGLIGRSISSSVLSGDNPTHFDSSNPITLFIIQLTIIIVFTQGLGWAFSFIRQPKVIAEVIGGIILGPTVMGRIPNFSYRIFPKESLPYLNLVATIGLILFLFLVGLEVDMGVMRRNGKASALISVAGMVVPFGLGSAVAVPVYHNFVNQEVTTFGHFLLFVGVAMAITAFPVLCRILTSTKLLDTRVGVIVLAAGVGNDVVGWVLLALTLALVNAKAGQTAVYILLCAVGWSILLLWPIKKGFYWLARRTGSIERGPTPLMMVLTLLLVFVSSFVTSIIGVHPIFGGFIAGLIIPHEGGFAIALVEKIDDLVSMLFLPIYFVLSGLSTNLGLLNTGKDWGFVIMLCVVAWVGKFFGCALMARALKYSVRECGAIGMLMSCKGLVELIVLNVGLSAGIIDQRLFSMFVVEAVVLTFITTPLTLWIYPESVRERNSRTGDKSAEDAEKAGANVLHFSGSHAAGGREMTRRVLVVLQKIEHLAAVMFLAQMLEPAAIPRDRQPVPLVDREKKRSSLKKLQETDISDESSNSTPAHQDAALPVLGLTTDASGRSTPAPPSNGVQLDALKLIELTGRTFSVMQSAEKDQLLLTDDALQLFRQFGRLRGLEVNPHIDIVTEERFPVAVADYATDLGSELVVLPWTIPVHSSAPVTSDTPSGSTDAPTTSAAHATFESVFNGASDLNTTSSGSPMYSHFLRRVFSECPSDIALFVDRGFGGNASFAPGAGQHVFLPFFGGADDRLALRLVVQLCHHVGVTATVVRIAKKEQGEGESVSDTSIADLKAVRAGEEVEEGMRVHQNALQSNQLTVGPASSDYPATAHRLASETADDIAWTYFSSASSDDAPRPPALETALSRISFFTKPTNTPLVLASSLADSALVSVQGEHLWRPLLVVLGRGRRGAAMKHDEELSKVLAEKGQVSPNVGAELRKTVGDVAAGIMLGQGGGSMASFLVLEAGKGR